MSSSHDSIKSQTVACAVKFSELCGLLEKIQKTQGNDKKRKVLQDFIEKWRACHKELHTNNSSINDSFHPAMRLLLPHLERERVAYGIKEHTLAKLLIELLCLGQDSPDAQRLLNYKAPKTAQAQAGDFANVAYFVLKNRCPNKGSLSISDVNRDLDAIASGNAAKAKETVRKHLMHLLTSLNATEIKWLIRMILKELKIGLSQASVLNVFHPDAEELYNVNNSLEKVCVQLHDIKTRAYEIGIEVFSPFTPMLGERASPDKVEKLMDNKPYLIETKFDGERVLLHKHGDEYKFFSRSGMEYTQVFGSNPYEGTLTPYISRCFKSNVQKCILDGEMMGYHAATKTFGTKGEQFDIKSRDVLERTGYQPCVQVFDVLLLNDKVLTNTPLRERLSLIDDVFTPVEGRIVKSVYKEALTRQDCADALNEAIDNKEEGIMVKLADSVYKPNTRKGGWFKIKPEYIGGLMDELDLLVVGGYFGVGERGGMVSHFLCAVAEPVSDGEMPTIFFSFCKVGSGYSKKQLKTFNELLSEHWQVYNKSKPPKHLELASGFKEKPDVWLPPDKSKILQIKATEIIESDRFKTGCTLRFPRVEVIRDDKPWFQCMTTSELEDLRQKSGGKLAGTKYEMGALDEPIKKKRKVVSHSVRPTLMAQFKGADISNIKQIGQVLVGKEFCVIDGPSNFPKQELETNIVQLGGTVVQNPDANTLCVIADKVAVKVKNLIKTNKYNIVKVAWLIKVIETKSWVDWSPNDMIHMTQITKKLMEQNYDCYGDSYTVDVNEEALRHIFQGMGEDIPGVSQDDIREIEEEYFPYDSPFGLFRSCKVYIDNKLVLSDPGTAIPNCSLDLLELELRFFGAETSDQLDSSISHVIVDESDLMRLHSLKEKRRTNDRKYHIMTEKWIKACIENGDLCPERTYEL
uniref:DNA ligase n=1 Tax=Biomphalaria glabrata TaxID=6526 RepID=A0A2C9JHQ7_BIOGL